MSRAVETGCGRLLCEVDEAVATITLNDPERRNPFGADVRAALRELVPRVLADDEVRCILLTGAGEAFSAGGDAKAMATDEQPPLEQRIRTITYEQEAVALLHEARVPVVAALPGPAAGAGLALALCADLRIAAESAFVTTAYARLGLPGDFGGAWFLTRLVGPARARELMFLSERIGADECLRMGLVNRVVPDDALREEARGLTLRLAAGPPLALARMKQGLRLAQDESLRSVLAFDAQWQCRLAETEDFAEATRAFLEKRAPRFQGR